MREPNDEMYIVPPQQREEIEEVWGIGKKKKKEVAYREESAGPGTNGRR